MYILLFRLSSYGHWLGATAFRRLTLPFCLNIEPNLRRSPRICMISSRTSMSQLLSLLKVGYIFWTWYYTYKLFGSSESLWMTVRVFINTINTSNLCTYVGSEWDYVILSTVRSLPLEDIDRQPSLKWKGKYLGFITDCHQINVAITRARKGLIIIG